MEALVNSARDNLTIEIDSIYAMKTCMEWMDARAAAGLPPVTTTPTTERRSRPAR